ncbi:hypothetical protein MKEN_00208700 [Mycena kentingensis (nom. inval.)]|nr:hypothetical protein MKEN_00208700 [Mycena kentingensis (nom. inval.)]
MPLLDIPEELVVAILLELPLHDLATLLKVGNWQLCDTISHSAAIQYHIQQQVARVRVNPLAFERGMSLTERSEALRTREQRWFGFSPSRRVDIILPASPDDIRGYTVDDLYIVRHRLDPLTLLGGSIDGVNLHGSQPRWRQIVESPTVVDFQVSSPSDLLLIVTRTPSPSLPNADIVQIECYQLSTGEPHPRQSATLDIGLILDELDPDTDVEVVGTRLAVALIFPEAVDTSNNLLYVLDWESGKPLRDPLPITTTAFTFIDANTLLLVSPRALKLVRCGAEDDGGVSFLLPALAPRCRMLPHTAQASSGLWSPITPNSNPPTRSRSPFLVDDNPLLVNSQFMLWTSRRNELLARFAAAASKVDIPFAEWGPASSRFLDLTSPWQNPCTSLAGQRYVSIAVEDHDTPVPVVVHDFTPTTVRRVRRLLADNPAALDSETAKIRIVEADANAPPSEQQQQQFHCPAIEPAERVVSQMAYVEITSTERFAFDAVHINNTCIIGDKVRGRDDDDDMIQVLYFG